MKSHLKAIEKAKSEKLECVLILEDDVELVSGFNKKLERLLSNISKWDMLFLNGSNPVSAVHYNDYWMKIRRLSGAYAYIVHSRFYDVLMDTLSKLNKPVDGYYVDLQKKNLCYLAKERLVKHLDGYSVRAERMAVFPQLGL